MLLAPWPAKVLRYKKFKAVLAEDGSPLFRGLRCKCVWGRRTRGQSCSDLGAYCTLASIHVSTLRPVMWILVWILVWTLIRIQNFRCGSTRGLSCTSLMGKLAAHLAVLTRPTPHLLCPCRLRMGVCEGTPQAMLHDHLGRADYHGATVNQVGTMWQ